MYGPDFKSAVGRGQSRVAARKSKVSGCMLLSVGPGIRGLQVKTLDRVDGVDRMDGVDEDLTFDLRPVTFDLALLPIPDLSLHGYFACHIAGDLGYQFAFARQAYDSAHANCPSGEFHLEG